MTKSEQKKQQQQQDFAFVKIHIIQLFLPFLENLKQHEKKLESVTVYKAKKTVYPEKLREKVSLFYKEQSQKHLSTTVLCENCFL